MDIITKVKKFFEAYNEQEYLYITVKTNEEEERLLKDFKAAGERWISGGLYDPDKLKIPVEGPPVCYDNGRQWANLSYWQNNNSTDAAGRCHKGISFEAFYSDVDDEQDNIINRVNEFFNSYDNGCAGYRRKVIVCATEEKAKKLLADFKAANKSWNNWQQYDPSVTHFTEKDEPLGGVGYSNWRTYAPAEYWEKNFEEEIEILSFDEFYGNSARVTQEEKLSNFKNFLKG